MGTKFGANLVVFAAAMAVMTLLMFLGLQLDLLYNGSWLRQDAQSWRWYHCFTSEHHCLTMLYLRGWWWLMFPAIAASFVTLLFWANSK